MGMASLQWNRLMVLRKGYQINKPKQKLKPIYRIIMEELVLIEVFTFLRLPRADFDFNQVIILFTIVFVRCNLC